MRVQPALAALTITGAVLLDFLEGVDHLLTTSGRLRRRRRISVPAFNRRTGFKIIEAQVGGSQDLCQ